MAIPWPSCKAQWTYSTEQVSSALMNFLRFIESNPLLLAEIDTLRFAEEISKGLVLQSNIPYGYGLGSSGALCASVLDRFGKIKNEYPEDIYHLLKEMESYFHGTSSGLDPLVSYYNKAIIMKQAKFEIKNLEVNEFIQNYSIKLIDSRKERNTKSLVSIFNENLGDHRYNQKMQELSVINRLFIDDLCSDNNSRLAELWKDISILSLDVFDKMIPEDLTNLWLQGINDQSYYPKLCGAGGGGLFLVMVHDEHLFNSSMEDLNLHLFRSE